MRTSNKIRVGNIEGNLKYILVYIGLGLVVLFYIPGCAQNTDSISDVPVEEEPGEKSERETENLIVVTIDGIRWQEVFTGADSFFFPENIGYIEGDYENVKERYWADTPEERRKKLMPFLWNELVYEGKIYGNRNFGNRVKVTNPTLKSFPGYCEIWNGYVDSSITKNRPTINDNLTVLEYINEQEGFRGNKMVIRAAGVSFKDLFHADTNEFTMSAGHKDSTVFNKMMRDLRQDHPRVAYMSVIKSDHWAHQKQYDTYLDKINEADSFIREVWQFIQSDEFYKDKTTLFVTTDHGRGVGEEWHTHGSGDIAHAEETWFVVAGPDTQPTGEQEHDVTIKATQFAKTMAAFLGLDFKADHELGEPVEEVMNFVNDQ